MSVKDVIAKRRAYRALVPVEITEELLSELTLAASLAPSCFNNQPWRYIFIHDREMLQKMRDSMSKGNEWTFDASMIITVLTGRDYDCIIREREYYLFDTGMATAFLILRATELGLVAHPIAGFKPKVVRRILDIPDEMHLLTLIIVGRHSETPTPVLSEEQIETEKKRPERLPADAIAAMNRFDEKLLKNTR
jgi:nitroreductase